VGLGVFSIFGSWFFYDWLWESQMVKGHDLLGHVLTLAWLIGMTYLLCHTLSGRAAYIHVGDMMGTWMTANVFMRIIPRQLKMVEASKSGVPVNQEWGKNAKNRSTHNTYFTLPVIFIMLSNHFPNTYGHEYNWLVLLLMTMGGAAIREYFVVRLSNPQRSMTAGVIGITLITGVIVFSGKTSQSYVAVSAPHKHDTPKTQEKYEAPKSQETIVVNLTPELIKASKLYLVKGAVLFSGDVPTAKKLNLPSGCQKPGAGDAYSNEVIVNGGKLQNVLITVSAAHIKGPFSDIPADEIIMDQRGCMYHPRVAVARVGQKVTFLNSDPIFHNVRSVTKENEKFNVGMPKKNQRETKIFNKPEMFLQAKCSVHPWMGAYVAVLDHPFYAISNKAGEFSLPALPAGEYTLEAWHEVFGKQTQTIKVDENNGVINFIFKKQDT
jgi:plastocyanin/uncharacterized membrane protein YgdD (TMEM256/DUF423 family)